MAAYFAMRIESGKLNYNTVTEKYPEYKQDIDFILTADGYIVNEDGTVEKQQLREVAILRRGTTPTLKFNLSIPVDQIASLNIAFAQNNEVIFEKTLEDCSVDADNVLKVQLSQENTIALKAKKNVDMQIRVLYKDGTADASDIISDFVDDILKDGVLA